MLLFFVISKEKAKKDNLNEKVLNLFRASIIQIK
nr:MAG TPA: hypothetical protein [Caudoviricetes sp.]